MKIAMTPELSAKKADADELTKVVTVRIAGLVEASAMSRKDIAAAAGITPARMLRKLRGLSTLTITDVLVFARVLQVDPSELLAA